MIGLNILAPVAVVGALAAFGTGYWAGNANGRNAGAQLALNAATIAAKEVVIKEVQVEKCEAEVTKVNEATTTQAVETVKLVKADQELRKQAEQRAIRSEKQAKEREERFYQSLTELKGLINEGAVQGCLSEPVGDRFAELFNNAIAAAEGSDGP